MTCYWLRIVARDVEQMCLKITQNNNVCKCVQWEEINFIRNHAPLMHTKWVNHTPPGWKSNGDPEGWASPALKMTPIHIIILLYHLSASCIVCIWVYKFENEWIDLPITIIFQTPTYRKILSSNKSIGLYWITNYTIIRQ